MNWKRYKDKIPPLGKILVSHNPYSTSEQQFAVITVGYTFARLDAHHYPKPLTEEDMKKVDGYWIELPELPKDEEHLK